MDDLYGDRVYRAYPCIVAQMTAETLNAAKDSMDVDTLNAVISFLYSRKEVERDVLQAARIGEAIWLLQDLRGTLTKN